MTSGPKTIIYPVENLAVAKSIYRVLLGVEPYMDEEWYVAFKVDGHDIGLDPGGRARGLNGPVAYWHVDDIRATLAELGSVGGVIRQDATDVGGGKLIATVEDADGNAIGLLQGPEQAEG